MRLYQTPDDRDYQRSEARGLCEAALTALSPHLRATVVLHYFHDYSQNEIAKILGIPSGTVASRMAKAMSIMRRWMDENDQSASPARSHSS